MQTTRRFKTPDKKVIEVELNTAPKNKTAVLIIYGLSGSTDQSMFYNAAQVFPKKGVDVWRIRLYGWHKGARTMLKISWAEMMSDIHQVLGVMAKEYKSLAVVGHSMGGGQAVYIDHPSIKTKILWDPACITDKKTFNGYEKSFQENGINSKYYAVNWGAVHLIPKTLDHEANLFYWYSNNLKALPKQPPLLVVRSTAYKDWSKAKDDWAQDVLPAKVVVVPHSDHCFTLEDGQNQRSLFAHTLKFIKANS